MGKAEEIKKYHELLSIGAITEDEYNKAKETILRGEEPSGVAENDRVPARSIADGTANYIGSIQVPQTVCDQIDLLISQGDIIQAIKCVREATRFSLVDSKTFVENHTPGIWDSTPSFSYAKSTPSSTYNAAPPLPPQVNVTVNQPKKKKGCLSTILTVFVILVVLGAIVRTIWY